MKIKSLVKKIPDFENNLSGRRNCIKGLAALTIGACLLVLSAATKNSNLSDVYTSLAASGATLSVGYMAIGVVQAIKDGINSYNICRI